MFPRILILVLGLASSAFAGCVHDLTDAASLLLARQSRFADPTPFLERYLTNLDLDLARCHPRENAAGRLLSSSYRNADNQSPTNDVFSLTLAGQRHCLEERLVMRARVARMLQIATLRLPLATGTGYLELTSMASMRTMLGLISNPTRFAEALSEADQRVGNETRHQFRTVPWHLGSAGAAAFFLASLHFGADPLNYLVGAALGTVGYYAGWGIGIVRASVLRELRPDFVDIWHEEARRLAGVSGEPGSRLALPERAFRALRTMDAALTAIETANGRRRIPDVVHLAANGRDGSHIDIVFHSNRVGAFFIPTLHVLLWRSDYAYRSLASPARSEILPLAEVRRRVHLMIVEDDVEGFRELVSSLRAANPGFHLEILASDDGSSLVDIANRARAPRVAEWLARDGVQERGDVPP